MRLQVVSWDGDTRIVYDGAIFKAWLPDEATGYFSQVAANVSFLKQQGATPSFLSQTPNEWYFPLAIQIEARDDIGHARDRDILAGLFPTSAERNHEKVLIVENIDDTDKNWQITGTPIVFKYGKDFIRIIIAVAEPRWIETNEQSDTDTYTSGVGVTLDPEPKGNTEFDPILEITPSSQRSSGHSGEEIAHFVEIINPAGSPALSNFPIDLSDGGWTHSTDVAAFDSLASGDDIRVVINGQTVNRWFSGINTASAKIWAYIDLPRKKVMTLGVALSAGGSETEIQLMPSRKQFSLIRSMPISGQVKIGTERFTYTGKIINRTKKRYKFTGVNRGALQSSKSAHSIVADVIRIPNQIWVYQGNTTVVDPPTTEDVADFEPCFELISTNSQWIYDTVFFDADKKRGWGFTNSIINLKPPQDNIIIGESEVFTANEGTFADPASVLGQKVAAVNDPNSNGTFRYAFASIAATLQIPFGIKAVTVEGRKAYDGTEWVTDHALWYTRGNRGGWRQKWNDSTIPGATDTWENLKAGVEATLHTLDASNGYQHILFLQRGALSGGNNQNWNAWQIDKCTLDFNSGEIPIIVDKFAGTGAGAIVAELQYVITNSATGDSIEVNATIEINDTLVLNFQTFDFYILADNIKLPVAVRPTEDITGHWFRLKGGEVNTITITDAGMPTTSMNVRWNARHL